MGKKSKGKSNGRKSGKSKASNATGSSVSSSSSSISASKVSADGRMSKNDTQRFYELLSFLAAIAVPELEARRKDLLKTFYSPIGWQNVDSNGVTGLNANSMGLMTVVLNFVLTEIDWLVEEVESKRHHSLFARLFSKKLLKDDLVEIRSWKLHVKDDFFYITNRPNEGAVFVQVGLVPDSNMALNPMGEWQEAEIHDPRVFVVRGFAGEPFEERLKDDKFTQRLRNPAIALEHPDATLAFVHMTLLPYKGGITFMLTMTHPEKTKHVSPKEMADAANIAIQAAHDAFIIDDNTNSDGNDADTTVTVYRTLNVKTDYHICRLKNQSDALPELLFPKQGVEAARNLKTSDRQKANNTTILAQHQDMFWRPYENENDPRTNDAIMRVCHGDKPFLLEGMEKAITTEIPIDDDDSCPFHNQFAFGPDATPSFKDCCKDEYLRRKLKGEKTRNPLLIRTMYEPLEPADLIAIAIAIAIAGAKKMAQDPQSRGSPMDLKNFMRVGFMDMGMVRFKIPNAHIQTIKDRLDDDKNIHAVLNTKWVFLGCKPAKIPCLNDFVRGEMSSCGIITFGDLELFLDTGIFVGNAMTNRRLTALIHKMKLVCGGIPILDASIEMQPSHKMKPDKEALERNQELLQDGLGLDVVSQYDINKKENECMRKRCAYCGVNEKSDDAELLRCTCKLVYFCSMEHQRAHWPNHKVECKRARANAKK